MMMTRDDTALRTQDSKFELSQVGHWVLSIGAQTILQMMIMIHLHIVPLALKGRKCDLKLADTTF